MGDRISIPTSDSGEESPESPVAYWMFLLAGVSIVLAIFVVTGATEPTVTNTTRDESITPPPPVRTSGRPALEAFVFPSTGVVTAVDEVDSQLVAVVTGEVWGSSVWRLDDDSGAWTLTDPLPALTALDARAVEEGVAVVGFDRFDASPAMYRGPLGDLTRIPIEFETGEVPYEIDVVSGVMYVFTRFDGGDSRAAYRFGPDGRTRRLRSAIGEAFVEDVFSTGGAVFAVGSSEGRPAMWRVEPDGDLLANDLEIDLDTWRIASAAALPSGEAIGLVVGEFAGGLLSTAVYRLEPPNGRLDEPIPGVWDRLLPAGAELLALPENLLALPASGVTVYRTDSGVGWVAGRARFTGPGGGGPGEGTIVISDAVFRASGDLVVSGASSGQASVPIIASAAPVGDTADIPSSRWIDAGEVEPDRQLVHVGGIHVAISEGVVTVREDFDEEWLQPVFEGEASVGGAVAVVELDFGYLLSATQPYPSVWLSSNGTRWQLIARDVIRMAGSGESVIAVFGDEQNPEILGIDANGTAPTTSAADPIVIAADRLGRVPSLGYVAGPVDGALYVSDAGVQWDALELGTDVEAIVFGRDELAYRTDAGWFSFERPGADPTPIRSPLGGEIAARRQVVAIDGGLLYSEGARLWVTTDFLNWTEVSFGAWEGADGALLALWAGEDRVVALLDGATQRTVFTLER